MVIIAPTIARLLRPSRILSPLDHVLINDAFESVRAISHSCKGEANPWSPPGKPNLPVYGARLAAQVERNWKGALATLLASDPQLTDVHLTVQFLLAIGERVNSGLVRYGRVWRTWESERCGHTPVTQIVAQFGELAAEFRERFHNPGQDPVAFAAWYEQRMNAQIHPLADGCGRTSKVTAAFLLARRGIRYPTHESRERYFEEIVRPPEEWLAYYRTRIPLTDDVLLTYAFTTRRPPR